MSIALFAKRRQFSPSSLFAANEQGAWYDPSDLSTLFQDSVGTTPVTAVEQPVGRILDKSGRGNHASQPTAAKRPTYSARYNLLTYTERFDNAEWGPVEVTVSANQTIAPDGTTTADLLTETAVNNLHYLASNTSYSFISGVSYTQVVHAKKGPDGSAPDIVQITLASAVFGSSQYANYNLSTGAVTYSTGGTATCVSLGNGCYRLSLTATATATTTGKSVPLVFCNNNPSATRFPTYAGNTGANVYIWGADLRPANDGIGLPAYQRVTTETDYDAVGFPLRISQDGVDDSWSVADGGGSTTAFFFCAAIRVNNTGAAQTIWSDTGTNTGYRVRINASNQLEMAVGNGSAYTTVNTTDTLAIGQRAVITCWHDGATIYAQIDRGAVASTAFATASAGTAGFTVGQDNGASSSYFKGGIYGIVQRKNAFLSDAVRSNLQRHLASKGLFSV